MTVFFACDKKDVQEVDGGNVCDNAQEYIKADILAQNYTNGCRTLEGNYVYDLPASFSYLIKSEDDFDKFFAEKPFDVDFEKQMVALHFFTSANMSQSISIKSIQIDDTTLKIQLKVNRPESGAYVSAPMQRAVAVRLDKTDIENMQIYID